MESNKFKTLEEIAKNYKFVLIDTSAILKPIRTDSILENLDEKLKRINIEIDSIKTLIPIFNKLENIYLVPGVIRELSNYGSHKYKKKIKNEFAQRDRRKLDFLRAKKETIRLRNKFSNFCEENNRVIKLERNYLEKSEIYKEKYKEFIEIYNLSEVDYDLLITGGVLANTALISNDFGIVRLWRQFLKKEKINGNKFKVFTRKELNNYEGLF